MKEACHVQETVELCWELHAQSLVRVSTGELNRFFQRAEEVQGAKARRGPRAPRIFYATQVGVAPPTIVLFVNDPALFTRDYTRFLQNQLRRDLPFSEIPIRLLFRAREKVVLPGRAGPRGAGREKEANRRRKKP